MNLELIGERQYIESALAQQGLWVLMKENTVYSVQSDDGNNLGTWNSQEDAAAFARGIGRGELKPVFVPLDIFTDSWLKSTEMNFTEIMTSPRHDFPALAYTAQELLHAFKT